MYKWKFWAHDDARGMFILNVWSDRMWSSFRLSETAYMDNGKTFSGYFVSSFNIIFIFCATVASYTTEPQIWHGWKMIIINCGHNIAITCTQNTNSWPQSRNNVRTKYQLIIWMSFLDSSVYKSSAPSLEPAIAYVMSLRWASYLILF